ncbi:MAG: hypothetical protein GX817_05510, partial [Elusimicrobia bacterium]|nr:hypothetical protein [Elusimicrobiota bacterium]
MQKKTKIIAAGVFLLLLSLFISVFAYLNSRKFTEHAQLYITARLSRETGYPIKIDRISTDVFTNLVLHGVRLYDDHYQDNLISIGKIRVRFSLLNIARNIRSLDKIIKEISIYEPSLVINGGPDNWQIQGLERTRFSSTGGPPPPWKLNIFNGDLKFSGEENQINISGLDFRISLASYPEASFRTSFALENFANEIRIDGDYYLVSRNLSMRIQTPQASLKETLVLAGYAEEFPLLKTGQYAADLKVELNLDQLETKAPSALKTSGSLTLRNASYGELMVNTVKLRISPRAADIEAGLMEWKGSKFNFSGTLSEYMTAPAVNISLSGSAD